jgi:hypothetical protein
MVLKREKDFSFLDKLIDCSFRVNMYRYTISLLVKGILVLLNSRSTLFDVKGRLTAFHSIWRLLVEQKQVFWTWIERNRIEKYCLYISNYLLIFSYIIHQDKLIVTKCLLYKTNSLNDVWINSIIYFIDKVLTYCLKVIKSQDYFETTVCYYLKNLRKTIFEN